jgi:hypothetical protein
MDILGTRNLHIPRFGGMIKPRADLTITLEWLGFWLDETADFLYPEVGAGRNQNGYGRNAGFNAFVGNEIDLIFNWRAASWSQLQAGYGHFFAGEYIRETAAVEGRSAEDAEWVYLQATFSF